MNKERYYITVVSKDHATKGVIGGFMQANHGKEAPLKRMKVNDWIIIYSPKQSMQGEIKCQEFTAIGQILDENIYQFKMTEDFTPFRRNVKYYDCKKNIYFTIDIPT